MFAVLKTMLLGATAAFPDVSKSAVVAYIHYLSFMLCFAALAIERRLLKASPNRSEAISMIATDVVYGIAGLALLGSGLLRVLYFGQGTAFYKYQLPKFVLELKTSDLQLPFLN